MGICFQVKHSSHSALPIQTSQNYNQCPMVCLKSHPSFRPKSLVRPYGFPRKDSNWSHGPGLAPKPPHGTTSAPAKQQALKKKMDIWRDTLRKRRWTPKSPQNWDSALAHGKQRSGVFWLKKKVKKKKRKEKKNSVSRKTRFVTTEQILQKKIRNKQVLMFIGPCIVLIVE